MPYFPTLKENYTEQLVIDEFHGYNHNLKIGDGEFYDMQNLTSSYFPLLANRQKRGTVARLGAPSALLGKSKPVYIDGSEIYYGGENITSYLTAGGCSISADEAMLPKQLVSMGAYVVIFPDKLYINTEDFTDCGSIEASYSTNLVDYRLCSAEGVEYYPKSVGSTAPEAPTNGTLWIDTSKTAHVLKRWNETTAMWVEIPQVYTKIIGNGIGAQFKAYDGVTISGCAVEDEALGKQVAQLNGSKIVYYREENCIVVVGILDQNVFQDTGTVTVKRAMPELDFVTEAENRLWGCKYGVVNGKTVNEIYCCALGDFKNWNQFLGLVTDSYVASVGTDGPWTGAVTHLGYPIFFKENCLHKVYISSKGAHQIMDTACRGVQKGSHNSLAVVNETLFFKSATDVCAYDGSLPVSVSSQFGTERYFDAAAGTLGDKYYISMRDGSDQWHLFVYDTIKGYWHQEDHTRVLQFARCNGELYYIDGNTKALIAVNAAEGEPESEIRWSATTGMMGYTTIEQKYISRFNLRMKLPVGSEMDIYVQYDSDDLWEHAGHIKGTGTKTFMLPVRPRRCDHFQIKLEGKGDVRIYSFAKVLERGSDVG